MYQGRLLFLIMYSKKIKIFIIAGRGVDKTHAMVVEDMCDVITIRQIFDRYDFAAGVLALAPDAEEEAYYIGLFEDKYPELAHKLKEFMTTRGH